MTKVGRMVARVRLTKVGRIGRRGATHQGFTGSSQCADRPVYIYILRIRRTPLERGR